MNQRQPILIPVSAGELADKVTILRIKASRITEPAKLENVRCELAQLEDVFHRSMTQTGSLESLVAALSEVNSRLWQVEDEIRQCEASGDFGPQFIELARSVYCLNDDRADLKRRINEHVGSPLIETKQYLQYR